MSAEVDYTSEEWMRGVPPPPPSKPEPRSYIVGIGLGLKDKLVPFVVRAGGEAPYTVLRVLEQQEVTGLIHEANHVRNELLKKHKNAKRVAIDQAAVELRKAREAIKKAEAEAILAQAEEERQVREAERWRAELGRVAAHSDGQAIHMAILLDPGPETFALFLTTRPTWARLYRPITRDEGILVGLRPSHRITFLAPVVRPRDEFSLTQRQFPESRVNELLVEFPKSYAS